MDSTTSRSQKRTNDRSVTGALPWVLGLAARVAPDAVAAWAEHRFLAPRRRPRPAWEEQILHSAERLSVEVDAGRLPVWSWGQGPAVVLVHGWEGRGSQLGAFVDGFVESGRRVVAFDAPAHGDAPGRTASIADIADAVMRVCDRVGHVEAVVAHSLGAAATMLASSRVSLAGRLVFLAPPLAAMPYAQGFARHIGLPADVKRRFLSRLDARLGMPGEAIDARVLAPRRRVDLLVLHDPADREVPFADGATVADAWHARHFVEVSGLGHRKILRDPKVVGQVVEFVTGREPRDRGLAGLERELFHRELRWVA